MEKLPMCRICLAENTKLRFILNTHLQEMYESLTLLPLETKDHRPLLVCYICCAKLQNCYDLKTRCLQSEELFTQMVNYNMVKRMELQENVNKTQLTIEPIECLSFGDEFQVETDNVPPPEVYNVEIKQEYSEGDREAEGVIPVVLRNQDDSTPSLVQKTEYIEVTIEVPKDNDNDINGRHEIVTKNLFNYDKVNLYDITNNKAASIVDEYNKAKYASLISLRQNTSSTSGSEKGFYTCQTCHQYFFQKDHFTAHVRTHVGEKPYQCNVCMKYYANSNNLMKHICINTSEKPFICILCGKGFVSRNTLTIHTRTHTGEKPYECDICKKCFVQRTHLISHMRSHSGEKPYKCHACSKYFVNQYVLNRHVRTHSGEKPYECDICQKRFTQRPQLITHIRAHTGQKPYKCTLCTKGFTRKQILLKHIQVTHE